MPSYTISVYSPSLNDTSRGRRDMTKTHKTFAVLAAISFSVAVYGSFGLAGIAVLAGGAFLGTCSRA